MFGNNAFVLTKLSLPPNRLWNGSPSHPTFILIEIAFSLNHLWNGSHPCPSFILTRIAFSSSRRHCSTHLPLHNSSRNCQKGHSHQPCPTFLAFHNAITHQLPQKPNKKNLPMDIPSGDSKYFLNYCIFLRFIPFRRTNNDCQLRWP